MCDFCNHIYNSEQEFFKANSNTSYAESEDCALMKIEESINIIIPDEISVLSVSDINFCPYCGRNLKR
jgi:hypothetical protein